MASAAIPRKAARQIANNHGRELYIYNHIQTKQVVYSFTQNLKNSDALKQIPFIGKKSRPAALRKDHWAPLATVIFPTKAMGLSTYHLLREFRKMHETMYEKSITLEKSKRERKYMIMDQKANSIADLAESLRIEIARAQEKKPGKEEAQAEEEVPTDVNVMVRWRNILDAEYAAEWPPSVMHGDQGRADRPYKAPKASEPVVGDLVVEGQPAKEQVATA
ncbi:hypothetical protein K440DRAFT_595223 [Wilcoxina mikolae CBS 423.85]|nr:hypothetical protein K440DRAFT_595223 [Wilcoxina mikolae CBS 423.85]